MASGHDFITSQSDLLFCEILLYNGKQKKKKEKKFRTFRRVKPILGFITEEGKIKSSRHWSLITHTTNTHMLQFSISASLFLVHAPLVILDHQDTDLPRLKKTSQLKFWILNQG